MRRESRGRGWTRLLAGAALGLSAAAGAAAAGPPCHCSKPVGVLSPDACFGYFPTRWVPWSVACPGPAPEVVGPAPVTTEPAPAPPKPPTTVVNAPAAPPRGAVRK
jgi:hypothetical protein